MLNKVDLPQPDGPMIDTNSPGAIENDTSSTAVITPSLVTKRLLTRSTSRSRMAREDAASVAAADDRADSSTIALTAVAPNLGKRGRHHRCIAPLYTDVDDSDRTILHRADGLLQRRCERIQALDRAPSPRTLRASDRRKIHIGSRDPLADPFVLDQPVAHTGDAFLMHLVVVVRAIIGDDQQQWNPIVGGSPDRGCAHQKVAVSANGDRQPAGILEREGRADRDARPGTDASAAIRSEEIERMAKRPTRAIP